MTYDLSTRVQSGTFDVLVDDPVSSSPYVRAFESEMARQTWRSIDQVDALRSLADSSVVLCGEFHPLPTACALAQSLLDTLGGRRIRLGLELVHARDQAALDAFARGAIGAREFKKRIRYREEWGYPFAPVLSLLKHAFEKGVEVVGLDIPPRGSAESLDLRDDVVAERIGSATDDVWVIIFGEAHLASGHLPSKIQAIDARHRVSRVICDHPSIADQPGRWFQASDDLFALRERAPDSRERAMQRIYRAWAEDEPVSHVDVSLTTHDLIDVMAFSLDVDPRRHRLREGLFLADTYPEVFSPEERSRAQRRLAELRSGERSSRVDWTRDATWRAHENLLILNSMALSPLAEACATFLVSRLRHGINPTTNTPILDRSLALALAKTIDPSIKLGRSSAESGPVEPERVDDHTWDDPESVARELALRWIRHGRVRADELTRQI